METRSRSEIDLRLRYDGAGPVYWNGGPSAFGLQDRSEVLHLGKADADGVVSFDFSLEVKPGASGAPVFLGPFAHGPAGGRFLYLSWRNREGPYAQRLKIPLTSIGWAEIDRARDEGGRLACLLVDRNPRATTTGANIGGTRQVTWTVEKVDG
jgi:hypothetical protein